MNIYTTSPLKLFSTKAALWTITQALKGAAKFSLGCFFLCLFGVHTFAQPPEIDVRLEANSIPSGNTVDVGIASIGSPVTATFTILNIGGSDLVLSGNPKVLLGGANQSAFSIIQPVLGTIPQTQAEDFEVTFSPTTAGVHTATLTILNNDPNEGTYLINITAEASSLPAPTLIDVEAVDGVVDIFWEDNSTTEQGFEIYRAKAVGSSIPPVPGPFVKIFDAQANVDFHTDIGVQEKKMYIYKVLAVAPPGQTNSGFSDTLAVFIPGQAPVSPSSLNAVALSQTEIQLEWKDNATNESGYAISRSETGIPGSFSIINTTGADMESYIDNAGLESNTTYYYKVRAASTEGFSPFTTTVFATTLSNAPASPTNLSVTPISGTELFLEWDDESNNEAGFIISRTTSQLGTFTAIDTVPANVTTYQNVGLTNNKSYFYYVQAFNEDGLSETHTNIATEKTADVPVIPTNVQLTVKDFKTIAVSWEVSAAPSTSREATGYSVELANILGIKPPDARTTGGRNGLRTNSEEDLTFFPVREVDANTRSVEITNLIPNQKYTFRVGAFNDNGNSPYSVEVSAVTLPDLSIAVPNAPTNLIAEAVSHNEIDITWSDNSSNERVFKIERKLSSATIWTEIGQVIGGTTSFSSLGLKEDSTYHYRVRASNDGGESAYSNVDSSKTECNLIVLVTNNSGGVNICSGKTSLLRVNTNVTDAVYQWKRNGINIPNANLPVYNADRTGEYDCQIIAGDCRKQSSVPVVVIVSSGFDVNIRTTDSLTQSMTTSIQGAQSYQWYHDYQPLKDAIASTYQPTQDGSYFVVVTNNDCSVTSNLITVAMTATGLSKNKLSNSMKLSPNPAVSQSMLEVENNIYGKYTITITDLQGRVCMVLEGKKTQTLLHRELPVQKLPQGVYLVRLKMKDMEGVQKLVR
ncbi:fibronectin type III domain-containing protein [uncultured Microscilla sp.]|uniref:fibronectin type III domain-containing protein n=1 Tax=uncultured Microscilla sp. TaxID=432653 RepID=UPI00261C6E61|nr:fibronectin type III domain-containing protein [uncultured Microscilla sp.]